MLALKNNKLIKIYSKISNKKQRFKIKKIIKIIK